jgi:hypothetical protein
MVDSLLFVNLRFKKILGSLKNLKDCIDNRDFK